MCPLTSRTGTVSVKVPEPSSLPHVGDRGVGREELDEVRDAAVVLEDLLDGALLAGRALEAPLVADDEAQPGDEEGGLAGTTEDGVVVEPRRP